MPFFFFRIVDSKHLILHDCADGQEHKVTISSTGVRSPDSLMDKMELNVQPLPSVTKIYLQQQHY